MWDHRHPQPNGGRKFELELLRRLSRDADRQIESLWPTDDKSLARYQDVVGTAWDILLRGLPEHPKVEATLGAKRILHDKFRETVGRIDYLTVEGHRAHLRFAQLDPPAPPKRTVIWIDAAGKAVLYDRDGSIHEDARRLLEAGARVVAADLLYQGSTAPKSGRPKRQRWLDGEEGHCGWTYCYNLPLFAKRVHDILALIEANKTGGGRDRPVEILARGNAAAWAAAAVVQSRGKVSRAALDTRGFRFAQLTDVYDADFLPGAVKYGDLPGLLALAAPTALLLGGEREIPEVVQRAYRSTNHPARVQLAPDETFIRLLTH